jgi:tetratricopeptide (TPR) repeat protein
MLLVIALPWGFQTIERPRDWRSYEALIDTDLRAYPGHYMPAMHKIIGVQLPRLYREASETANSITIPELRGIMIEMVEADHAVNVSAVATGKPQEAMALLWKLGLDLKQRPVQAKWNSPINNLWVMGDTLLTFEWGSLAKQFPDDASVRYNTWLWMLGGHDRYKDAVAHLRAATESQRLPESVRGAAFYSLGLALMNSRHVAEAEVPLRAALEQPQPDLRAHCLLSEVYKQTRRFEEAARAEASCPGRTPNEEAVR